MFGPYKKPEIQMPKNIDLKSINSRKNRGEL
jgi:hypothetical protein